MMKTLYISLNSTMVRLQRMLTAEEVISMTKVSIPLWFDYNLEPKRHTSFKLSVSIPLWFDYNKALSHYKVNSLYAVSIPLWFDYNLVLHQDFLPALLQSQFHYGSITTLKPL